MQLRRSLPALLLSILIVAGCGGDGDDPVTPPPPPRTSGAIDDMRVTSGADGAVTLAWTSPQLLDKAGYDLTYALRTTDYGTEGLPWEDWTRRAAPMGDTEAGVLRTHEVTGLTAGRVYVFQLRAMNAGTDWSGGSNLVVATASPSFDTTPPEPVTDLAQIDGSTSSLTVAWSVSGGDGPYGHAPHYQVRYAQAPITEENWAEATYHADLSVTGADRLTAVITGLAAETGYYVAVRASDDAGNQSALSNVPRLMTVDLRVIEVFVDGSGDQPTIEAALVAAQPGDLILVGPGRYTWTNQGTGDAQTGLIWVPALKDSVELRSTHGPEQTIIDGEGIGPIMHINGGTVDPPGGERYWTGITIDGFTFTGGKAVTGTSGLTYGGGALSVHLSDSVIRNCVFTGNRAIQGGAVWIGGQGAAVLEDCLITGNSADYGGGVALVNSEPMISVRNCEIVDNNATFTGGGIWLANCNLLIEDCLVAGNDANTRGGGIAIISMVRDDNLYIEYTGLITGCTVADNDAPVGAGITLQDIPDLTVSNTIVAFNTGGRAIQNVKVNGLHVGCTDLFGNVEGSAWVSTYDDLGGNIEADPKFCDRVDYRLRSDSPCLDECGRMGARGVGCAP